MTVKQGIQTYTSSDYSQDGQVTKIHSATVGKGIDVVFVGDAFADKDQDLFNKYVKLGKEAFFTEEPFRSTKDRFNIYRIGSVSKNGIIAQEGGDTKFSAQFGQGTNISGDDKAVFSFVQEKIPSVDLTKTIIFVIINKAKSPAHAGCTPTTWQSATFLSAETRPTTPRRSDTKAAAMGSANWRMNTSMTPWAEFLMTRSQN